jgi:DNA-binding XRE family transcriptional regulator
MAKINIDKIKNLRINSIDRCGDPLLINTLSAEIGVAYKVVSRMETDDTYNPGVLTMLKLSEYFNVRIDDLIIKD